MENYTIYKIVCKDKTVKDCYVGYTKSFHLIQTHHNTCCNNKNNKSYNRLLYNVIRDNGGWNNWFAYEIDSIECYYDYEARERERYWIDKINPTLNQIKPKVIAKKLP